MLPTRNAVSENVPAERVAVYYNAVIWLDHDEAQVIYFSADMSDPANAKPEHWSRHLRPRVDASLETSVTAMSEFYRDIAKACEDADAVVLAGPSIDKTEFVKYLHRHSPETFDRISDIETLSRLTDNQLIAEARRIFARRDHARPQLL